MSGDPHPEEDPRPRRALFLGGALLAAIVLYNMDLFDSDPPVVISMDHDERDELRDDIRHAVRDARDDIRQSIRDARDGSREAVERAQQDGDEAATPEEDEEASAGVSIEPQENGGVRITVGTDTTE